MNYLSQILNGGIYHYHKKKKTAGWFGEMDGGERGMCAFVCERAHFAGFKSPLSVAPEKN